MIGTSPSDAGRAPLPGIAAPDRVDRYGIWPVVLFIIFLCLLYEPVIAETAVGWVTDPNFAHGIFIFPVSAWLLWMQRHKIRKLPQEPTLWGMLPLALGCMLETVGYLLGSKTSAMISIIPVLAGGILIFHGRALWKIACFPVCFLAFAARMPLGFTYTLSDWVQRASTNGAVFLTKALGYSIIQRGNVIEVLGVALEVADACSGFKKLIALVAFSLLYGYLFKVTFGKRVLLVLAAVPIAVIANIVRVSGLIAIASAWGPKALHIAHDSSEMVVVVTAVLCFILFGRSIGCEKTRFSD